MSNWTNEGRNALAASKPNHPTCAWADDADGKVKKQPPDLTAGEFNRRE